MVTKEELLVLLETALKTEEAAIPLYTEHINSTLFLSGFDKDKKERIRQILQTLYKGSSGHARIYQRLIHQIENGDKDVY